MFYHKKKIQSSFFLLIFLLIATLTGGFFIFEFKKFEREVSQISLAQISISPSQKQPKTITLIFVGDIMLNRGVELTIKKYGQGDWEFPFLEIADFFNKANILFGNLEGPISDKGVKVGSIYFFRNNPEAIKGLVFAGFDILSVANNHIFDYGRIAMEDTFLRLREVEINYVGGGLSENEAYSPVIKEVKDIKIAFLAYTNLGTEYWSAEGNRSGIAWLKEEELEENIKEAKKLADLVIVSMHFGEEYSSPTPEQEYFAHLAIDSGANLVIGHHPHVIQEIEKYGEGFIAYSLGNFIFDQGFSEETMKGLMLKVLIKNGKIKELIPIEIKINQFFQPELLKNLAE